MNIKELRQRHAELVAKGRDIQDTATESEWAAHMDEVKKIEAQIKRAEEQADAERSIESAAAGPAASVSDRVAARFAVRVPAAPRTAADASQFGGFGEFLQAVALAGMNDTGGGGARATERDPRLAWGFAAAATGANESVPSEGGFLVQTDHRTDLLDLMHEMGDLLPLVRRIPVSAASNGVKLPMIDETSRANGSRFGGVLAYWADEADTVTASKPKFRSIDMSLKKLFGLSYATEELLQDAAALEAVMRTAFAEELTFKTEDAIINGTGAGQPLGILNSGALVSVSAESGQAAATIRTENILNMWARMPARHRRNAVWLINQEIEPQLYPLTLGSGTAVVLLYFPPGSSQNSGAYGTLMGRPVIPVEYTAALGTVGDIMLIDPQSYVMIDKGGTQSDASMHVRFIYDEMAFRFIYRVDGQPTWRTSLTRYKGTNALSPYVALATR